MMPLNKSKGTRGFLTKIFAPIILLLLSGNKVLAAASSSIKADSISIGEVLLYVGLIAGIILVAWFFGTGQAASSGKSRGPEPTHFHRRDPHFRRIRRKTS